MHLPTSLTVILLSFCAFQVILAGPPHSGIDISARHYNRRLPSLFRGEANLGLAPSLDLQKRFAGVPFTFFQTGKGACGTWNNNGDFIVALNHIQFSSDWCGKTITISSGGKTTQAIIEDECMGCGYGGLDLSPGLFAFFAPQYLGEIYGSWFEGTVPPPPPPPPPPTITQPPPPPTPTSGISTSTTTWASSSTGPSSTPLPTGNLYDFGTIILNLANLTIWAAEVQSNSTAGN